MKSDKHNPENANSNYEIEIDILIRKNYYLVSTRKVGLCQENEAHPHTIFFCARVVVESNLKESISKKKYVNS